MIHGDDFTILAHRDQAKWLHAELKKKYEIELRGMIGPSPHDDKTATILNRLIEWRPEGIWYEADARHVDILLDNLSISPNTKTTSMEPSTHDKDSVPLIPDDATRYRADVARMNFMGQDRCDLTFPVKELSRDMATPTIVAHDNLKRGASF